MRIILNTTLGYLAEHLNHPDLVKDLPVHQEVHIDYEKRPGESLVLPETDTESSQA